MNSNDKEVTEAMARLFLAQDALRRLGKRPEVITLACTDLLDVTRLVAESLGWLQVARRHAA